jgi:hypothetical protein
MSLHSTVRDWRGREENRIIAGDIRTGAPGHLELPAVHGAMGCGQKKL